MATRGRKPFEDELRLRERIESLYWSGLRSAAIRDALASPQNAVPIDLSIRQVQTHVATIRRTWRASAEPGQIEAERAELVAGTKDTIRVAAASSARYRDSAVGVGYLNSQLRGMERLARLLGLDAERRAIPSTPAPAPDVHPLDGLSSDEQIIRFRELAGALEEIG